MNKERILLLIPLLHFVSFIATTFNADFKFRLYDITTSFEGFVLSFYLVYKLGYKPIYVSLFLFTMYSSVAACLGLNTDRNYLFQLFWILFLFLIPILFLIQKK